MMHYVWLHEEAFHELYRFDCIKQEHSLYTFIDQLPVGPLAMVALGDHVYCVPESEDASKPICDATRIDLRCNTVKTLPTLPDPRNGYPRAAYCHGGLYCSELFLFCLSCSNCAHELWSLDFHSLTWSQHLLDLSFTSNNRYSLFALRPFSPSVFIFLPSTVYTRHMQMYRLHVRPVPLRELCEALIFRDT